MNFGNVIIKPVIIVLGLCGFMVARHIRNHKIANKPLVCPIKFDCNSVVQSDYSKFLGVPVEVAGMIYYAFITLAYLFLVIFPNAMPADMIFLPVIFSLAAFLFSLYLLAVQIFMLRKGCSWCIVSSIISSLIFILSSIYVSFLL